MPRRRALTITLKPLPLILSIALGLWLGAVAIAASLWLAHTLMPTLVEAPKPATAQDAPRAATPPTATPTPDAQADMFERYKDMLHKQQLEQAAEAAQGNPRNLNSPKCQFWLQQHRTAPTDKSQANVLEFCY
ncbi:hypothetical protein ACI2J9_13430 [Pseudomonas fulva]|uniref:hypothetical protein n=1 Tax=Pseudomonas fulva TaxID=47880 RepID=UPI003850C23F